jgi:hypothetical protein
VAYMQNGFNCFRRFLCRLDSTVEKKVLSLHAHTLNVAPLYVLIDRSIALIESVGDWIIGDWIYSAYSCYMIAFFRYMNHLCLRSRLSD